MKNVFRYKTSSICFFVGMAFSFIALYYGNRSEFKLRNAMMEKNGNKYQYETDVSYYGTSFLLPIGFLKATEETVSFVPFMFHLTMQR